MDTPPASRLLDLVAAFYDAGLGLGSWQDALDKLAVVFGAASANLVLQGSEQGGTPEIVAIGVDEAGVEIYVQHYAVLNPVFPAVLRVPVGAPFTDSMVASRDVTLRSEFYNDWAHPNGLDQCLFSVLIREGALNGSVCVSRSAREGEFEQPHIELLALLVSHLQRAAYAQIRLAQAGRRGGCLRTHLQLGSRALHRRP